MNIIIVGCGSVGRALASELNESGNNITVMDLDAAKVKDIAERLDVMGVVGNGATYTSQRDAGIENADLLIAVTDSDELNLLCCIVAKKESNCKTIARVQNPSYNGETAYIKDKLGLEMVINPERITAEEIARVLRFPSALKVDTFAKGKVELIKFKLPENSALVGMAVKDVVAKLHCDVLICTVEREGEAYIAKGDFVFKEKDVISIVSSPKNIYDFFKKINYNARPIKSVMIAGGGVITHYLCDILSKTGISVKIIEKDMKVCEEIGNLWKNVTVINGDAGNKEILLEEGISGADAFVALTDLDEENIILSLFARTIGELKLVTKIRRTDFDSVLAQLDLDSIINPQNETSDKILATVRGMKNTMGSNVATMYNLIQGKVEASEFIIKEDSEITSKSIAELKFKNDILIAAILRGNEVIIPRGYDKISVGDSVIVVSGAVALYDITDILR